MKHELPKLDYSYDALEPYIDAKTMEIHHSKHHQGYVDKLNKALEDCPEFADKKLEDILHNTENVPVAIRNNGGGHLNHSLFWQILDPKAELDKDLIKKYKEEFSEVALKHFGSGWAWLVKTEEGGYKVYSLPNQDSPYILGHVPVLGLDVWEHAYYLKYQNRRAEYIEGFWSILKI